MKNAIILTTSVVVGSLLLVGCGDQPEQKKDGTSGSKAPVIAQKTCPVMEGGKIDPKLYADHKGRRIYFCCKACIGMFKKDPEKYVKKVDEELAKLKAGGSAPKSKGSTEKGHEGHRH